MCVSLRQNLEAAIPKLRQQPQIMYIYHVLINTLSAHMIHINLNLIFYTHAEHSPTKTVYIKYHTKNKNKKQL